MSHDKRATLKGSGAIAQDGVAAGEGGVAVDGDVSQSTVVTGDHNVVNVTYQGIQVAIPSPGAIAHHRIALRKRLEDSALARWGGMSVYIQEQGATLPIEASPYQTGRLGPRENLLQTLHAAGRLLVLGEAGSGKTVSLERLAWELCGTTEPAIPVLVRLFRYAGTPLAAWVRASLQETGHLRLDDERALSAFLKESGSRCFFLFDGLNEVPPSYRDHLVDELSRWISSYPRHPVILTSRPQDELWRRLRGEVTRAVVVQAIGDEQARAYLVAHLHERGTDLYRQLDDRLRTLARTPLVLWLIKEAGAAGESVPGNRGELYARFVSRMLRRDTDRRMDAEIPERVKRRALADLAYHLGREQRLSCSRDEAVELVTRRLGDDLADPVVGACARHGLLAGDDPVWFAPHQTVQEHFAALALREVAEREWSLGRWERIKRAGRRLLAGRDEGLAGLAADDWWMETFVQLAGLVDDADRLAQEVVRGNPWLAWWCVEEGRGVTDETRAAVANRSVRLLESDQVENRRRAVAALAQMRSERVVQPLFRAAADEDEEIAGLTVQTLVEMGEAARAPVIAALKGRDQLLWKAALRYLRVQPNDVLWAEIPERMWNTLLDLDDRRRAVVTLAQMRSERVVQLLLRAAADEDEEVAGLAVQTLVELGEAARAPIVVALQGKDQLLWRAALRYLRVQPNDVLWAEIPERMWNTLLDLGDRLWAVTVLAQIRSERVVQPLFRAAADENGEVARLAVQALAELGEMARAPVVDALQSTDRRLWRAALRYLIAQRDDSLCQQVPWGKILGQPMAWVPPGSFLMGSDKARDSQAYDDELPQHKVALSGYWIGRYPVTVVQFRAFVKASGYKPHNADSLNGPDDHPVTRVTWHDALAFCHWLSKRTGLPVTLPSEAEWEKAARGTDGRLYPWGDDLPDEHRCNFKSRVGGTTPIGRYSPQGDSPYGCADIAGNVWEWTRSHKKQYPYDPTDGREDMSAGDDVPRVLRGGSFISDSRLVRCALPLGYPANFCDLDYGFRLVMASPSAL